MYDHVIKQGEENMFEIHNKEIYHIAIEWSVSQTLELIMERFAVYVEAFCDQDSGSTIHSNIFKEGGKYGQHWSSGIDREMLLWWKQSISRQGVFNLGCKHPKKICCNFPLQKRFTLFLQDIGTYDYVVYNDYNGCCANTRLGTGWNPSHLVQHSTMNNTNDQHKQTNKMVSHVSSYLCL